MAYAVTSSAVVKLVEAVESPREAFVKNDGPNSASVSKDPGMTAAGADAFVVAANAQQEVSLEVGQGLYAICAAGNTASLEVI